MRMGLPIVGMVGVCLAVFIPPATAWVKTEHRQLGDRAFARVASECQVLRKDSLIFDLDSGFRIRLPKKFWGDEGFGELCASFSGNDLSPARLHAPGQTIMQLLKLLTARVIDESWSRSQESLHKGEPVRPVELPKANVVSNYLLHHLVALRLAHLAGKDRPEASRMLRRALAYEALAQGYLADAFSSGHLLLPMNDPFYGLHSRNNQESHDFYCSEGVFVLNSKGEVWRTFGDRLLNWYAASHEHVLEACVSSLRELFLVLYVSAGRELPDSLKKWSESISPEKPGRLADNWLTLRNGNEYYELTQMPTLLLLPMPVSATWSVKNTLDGNPRNNHRKHFPQLREEGLHDPDLDPVGTKFLFRRKDVPNWLVPDWLAWGNPDKLIRKNPEVASVRFIQQSTVPPSYVGLLLKSGGGVVVKRKGKGSGLSFGLGYGLVEELLFLKKVSVDAVVWPGLDEPERFLIGPSMGFGIKLPFQLNPFEAFHFEQGYVWGFRSPYKSSGLKFAVGLDSRTIPLGFTYAGVTVRLKYEWLWLERTKQAVIAEVILH